MKIDKRPAELPFPQQQARRRTKPTGLLRRAILGAVGLLLAWEVMSRSVAAYLADVAPETALLLNAQQPAALASIAYRMLIRSQQADSENCGQTSARTSDQTARRNHQIRTLAESAIMNEPINARAARILGQLADAAKNDVSALQFMDAAVHFSVHEAVAAYWMMQKNTDSGNYKEAIYFADTILRTHLEFSTYIVPALAKMAENERASGQLVATLSRNPPWRGYFFTTLPKSITDARTPLALLLALRTTSAPPTSADIDPYLTFLIAQKFFNLAYYTWLQFLPPEKLSNVRLLFNGSFETPSSGGPFEWTIIQGSGVTIDIVPRPDDSAEHALLVQFQYGRVDFHAVTQLVLLAPGTYKFKGKHKSELVGPSGLKWHITCASDTATAQIGEGPVITGTSPAWKSLEFSFTVPEAGCEAQYVRLDLEARTASERLVSGAILFDELEILRLANPPT